MSHNCTTKIYSSGSCTADVHSDRLTDAHHGVRSLVCAVVTLNPDAPVHAAAGTFAPVTGGYLCAFVKTKLQ